MGADSAGLKNVFMRIKARTTLKTENGERAMIAYAFAVWLRYSCDGQFPTMVSNQMLDQHVNNADFPPRRAPA
jgi:hypothetical protein